MENIIKIGQKVNDLLRAMNDNVEQVEMLTDREDATSEMCIVPVVRLQYIADEIFELSDTLGEINKDYLKDSAE